MSSLQWFTILLLAATRCQCLTPLLPSFYLSNKLSIAFGNIEKALQTKIGAIYSQPNYDDFTDTYFASLIQNGPVPPSERNFLINGWRWHTISVIRDIDRFVAIIKVLKLKSTQVANIAIGSSDSLIPLQCFEFVCNFNWKALRKVESEIFFPWLRNMLLASNQMSKNEPIEYLFSSVLRQHSTVVSLSLKLSELCLAFKNAELPFQAGVSRLEEIETTLLELKSCALNIQHIQVLKIYFHA